MSIPYSAYEAQARKKVSTRSIWLTVIALLIFSILNLNLASWSSVAAITSCAAACIVALFLNYRNHVTTANLLACASVLIAITYSIYDGDGLLDPGVFGYLIFILLGTLLLDKRYTPWLTLAAILCLGFIAYLQKQGLLHLTIHINDASNLLPISIFVVIGAFIVWVILDNLQNNYKQLRKSEDELRRSYDLTIQGLSKAIDLRDVDTGGHSIRVVELTEKLAHAMNVPQDQLIYIRYGAYLHDLGKLGIPDSILFKPGPLNEAEWEVMRTHPLRADDILASIPYLDPARDIPKYHHEHWDGSGYPAGLQGTTIPLAARLFAVIDVWDALTNVRPYRPAWSGEKTREYIASLSGKQFDPEVVTAFLKIIA